MSYQVVKSEKLSSRWEERFVIVDSDTGELLDDAQGYGYKSKQKAHAGYGYKTKSKAQKKADAAERKAVRAWCREHKGFCKDLDQYIFEIECKGSWAPDDKVDAAFIRKMARDYEVELPCAPGRFNRLYRKM